MPATPRPQTPAWPPRSAPRLFVEQTLVEGRKLRIESSAAHYLGRVMRAKAGDTVILCDDATGEWAARIEEASKRDMWLMPVGLLRPREEVPDFWLCPALLKKNRFDIVLEKATELGVGMIRPTITARCVATKLNASRARTLIKEAAEQCARTALPFLDEPSKLSAMLKEWPTDRTLYFADELGGETAAEVFAEQAGPAALITGPEGGFDDGERKMLLAHPNVKPITLGPRILRGETATLAAVALWMGVAGDW